MSHYIEVGAGVSVTCGSGGTLTMLADDKDDPGPSTELIELEVTDSGFVGYDDVFIDTADDLYVGFDNPHDSTTTVKHLTGDEIAALTLTADVPNTTATLRFEGLQPGAYYRLYNNGRLAQLPSGVASDKAGPAGQLQFNEVPILQNE